MELHDKVLQFIGHFNGSEEVFLHGCCYWFAEILEQRFFVDAKAAIKYEPVEGHFMTEIDGRLYDIRGDVTDMYGDKELYDLDEMRHDRDEHRKYWKLMRECRDFDGGDENA